MRQDAVRPRGHDRLESRAGEAGFPNGGVDLSRNRALGPPFHHECGDPTGNQTKAPAGLPECRDFDVILNDARALDQPLRGNQRRSPIPRFDRQRRAGRQAGGDDVEPADREVSRLDADPEASLPAENVHQGLVVGALERRQRHAAVQPAGQ
jgi:hypothetical protein